MSEVAKPNPAGETSEPIGEHVVVKSIEISFNKGIKPSKELEVFISNKRARTKWTKAALPKRTHRWIFKCEQLMFPDDKLIIRPFHSRKDFTHFKLVRDEIDSHTILVTDIVSSCIDHSTSSTPDELDYRTESPGKFSLVLKVSFRNFNAALVEVDTSKLNEGTISEVLDSLSSSESLQEAASQLRSVFEKIGANVEVIENWENVLENVASAHPIVQAAVCALLIPCKLLKAEHEFKKDMQSLADEMRFLLKLLEDERWIAKISSTKDTVMEIMKEVIDTSVFINDFVNKGKFKQFGAAQTRTKLDVHIKNFGKLRKNFETALNLQNAGLVAHTASTVDKIAADDDDNKTKVFLKEKLAPAEQLRLGDLCLEGTRTAILARVEEWLKDFTRPNVFWITGAPGAGKSTISATIVRRTLKKKCAMFFAKRSATPELRDPQSIWRTIAFDLAKLYPDIKNDIEEALKDNKDYPKDAEVGEQFRDLLEPIIRKHAESFPVERPCIVVIDALDECSRASNKDWSDLLETLADWRALPPNAKLIVTSRDEIDIRKSLHHDDPNVNVVLKTGDQLGLENTMQHQKTSSYSLEKIYEL